MDTPADNVQDFITPNQTRSTPDRPDSKNRPLIRFGIVPLLILIVLFCVTTAGGISLLYARAYDGHLYRGISALGLDLSGYSRAEAKRALTARFDQYSLAPLTLRFRDKSYPTTAAALGLRFDADSAVDQLYALGRTGDPLTMMREQVNLLFNGYQAHEVFPFDPQSASTVLNDLVSDINRPAVNATLVIKKADQGYLAEITPAQTGWQVNIDKTKADWSQTFTPFVTKELAIDVDETQPAVSEQDLTNAQTLAQQIIGSPVTVKYSDRVWQINTENLAAMVQILPVAQGSEKAKVKIDEKKLQDYAAFIAGQINHPARDASISIEGTSVVVVPAENSATIDQNVLFASLMKAVQSDDRTVVAPVTTSPPHVTDADIAAVKDNANALFASQLLITYNGHTYTFSKDRIAKAVKIIRDEKDGKPAFAITLNQDALKDWISAIADEVDQSAKNALFRMAGNDIQVIRESATGIKVDEEGTLARVNAQAYTGEHTIALQYVVTKPDIQSVDRSNIVIKEMLMESSTTYAGSVPPRKHNVELAADKLNGVLIAPGQVFSFNDYLGPQTLAAGFQVGYGIVSTESGGAQTVPSVAGGICQVATTLYHSVFWTGLPIIERNWHLYWIPRYTSKGLVGMDATVDDTSNVDLKFKNTTGNWIAIKASTYNENLTFQLWGVNPGWKVEASQPEVKNIVKTDPTMQYEKDPTMPTGESLLVEHAEDGFDVSITRTVKQGDQVIDQHKFDAHYQPSHNVTLVGTGGAKN